MASIHLWINSVVPSTGGWYGWQYVGELRDQVVSTGWLSTESTPAEQAVERRLDELAGRGLVGVWTSWAEGRGWNWGRFGGDIQPKPRLVTAVPATGRFRQGYG